MKYVFLEKAGEMPRVRCGWSPDTHEEIAAPLVAKGFHVVSAGFVRGEQGKRVTVGESTSLKIESRPDDAQWINAFEKAEAA